LLGCPIEQAQSSGQREGGAKRCLLAYLASLRSGELRYESFERSETRMIVLGSDVVLVSGQIQIQLILGGTRRTLDNIYVDVWTRREGRWRMVSWQSTPVHGHAIERTPYISE
jgi:Domain of unknown function (DUF4440)